MKVILEFDCPEENEEMSLAINGWKWMNVVHEMDNFLRSTIKHSDKEEEAEIYQKIRDKMLEFRNDLNLQL